MKKRKIQKHKKKNTFARTTTRTKNELLLDKYGDNFSHKSSYDLSKTDDRILFIAALCLDNIAWNVDVNFEIVDWKVIIKTIAAKMTYLEIQYANDDIMKTKLDNIEDRYTDVCRGAMLAKKIIIAANSFKAKEAIKSKLNPLNRITDYKDKARAKSIITKIRELIPCYQG